MPIYEYVCEKCVKVHEIIQKFSDEPIRDCPDCGAPVAKKMSLSSFSLKGSGWYSTDYKKTSGAPAATSTPAANTAPEAAGSAPAAATPATTKEAVAPVAAPSKANTTAGN